MANKVNKNFIQLGSGSNYVLASLPPSADEWTKFSQNANHFIGKGNQLIPVTSFWSGGLQSGDFQEGIPPFRNTYTFEMYVWPKREATTREWTFSRQHVDTKGYDVGFDEVGATPLDHPMLEVTGNCVTGSAVDASGFETNLIGYRTLAGKVTQFVSQSEAASGQGGSIYALTMSVSGGGEEPQRIQHRSWFSMFEHNRAYIPSGSWADVSVFEPVGTGQPVRDFGSDTIPVKGTLLSTFEAMRETRKAGLWYYVRPISTNGTYNTDVSGVLIADTTSRTFAGGLGIPIQTRDLVGATTSTVQIKVLGRASSAGAGIQMNFTSSWSGTGGIIDHAVLQYTFGSTDPEWFSGSIDVGTDTTGSTQEPDNAESRIQFSRFSYLGESPPDIYIYSICIGENDNGSYESY